ncbi:MAG: hypothetical protein IAE95_01955 [Chitinophagaceae bacterium]|nr:hypothetical protein [Chitinophagaceae bacterium]
MDNQASIRHISLLMASPSVVSDGDGGSISELRQSYPYFVPARYAEAALKYKNGGHLSELTPGVLPYSGNWMLLCDYISGVSESMPDVMVAANELEPAVNNESVADERVLEVIDEVFVPVMESAEELSVATEEPKEIVIEDEAKGASAGNLTADAVTEDLAEELETQHKSFWVQDEETDEEEADTEFEEEPVLINEKPLISPVYTDDYFLAQGERVSVEMPDEITSLIPEESDEDAAKSLMVMMSFSEWLLHFKSTTEKLKEENKDQKALKTMWQKEKLAAAIEEENEEIPENVFEMAVNSIAKEDGLASESLAEIYIKQGKYDKAIEMYRKLSLRNPQKNAYFARKIEEILKEKQS